MINNNNEETKFLGSKGDSQNWAVGNNFYIFDGVDDSFPRDIIAPFIEAAEKQRGKAEPQTLHLWITSPGGYVKYGFDLIAHMERAVADGIPVYTYVTSEACSCGSLIAVAGSKRFIGERAYHLLHFMRGADYAHNPIMLERNYENGKFWQQKLVEIYRKYTKIKDIEEKLLADNYMVNGAKACIKLGIADETF